MRNKFLTLTFKKGLVLTLAIFSIIGSNLFAQTVEGGAGVVHVDGDPNAITALQNVTVNEAHIAYDTSAQVVYFFDQDGTAGVDQWIGVNLAAANTSVTGSGDITVTNPTPGVYNVDFSETHTTLTWDPATNELTYNSEDGPATVLDLSGSVDFDDSANINVATGDGTAASPYTFIIDGSDVSGNDGFVPVTDGAGNLTWEKVVKSAAFLSTGELQLTFTDDTTVLVNMEGIPTVQNVAQLTAAAAAVDATSGGIARAAATNTFGLPANNNVGVLFFISN